MNYHKFGEYTELQIKKYNILFIIIATIIIISAITFMVVYVVNANQISYKEIEKMNEQKVLAQLEYELFVEKKEKEKEFRIWKEAKVKKEHLDAISNDKYSYIQIISNFEYRYLDGQIGQIKKVDYDNYCIYGTWGREALSADTRYRILSFKEFCELQEKIIKTNSPKQKKEFKSWGLHPSCK